MTFIIICICVVAVILAISYITYRMAFYNPTKEKSNLFKLPDDSQYDEFRDEMNSLVKTMQETPFEVVETTSYDGLKLFARYYHYKDNAPLHIQFHGYKGSAFRDFCGNAVLADKLGFNALIVDQRGHGNSDGNTICFGIKERYDVLSWIGFALDRFGGDLSIILSGVSMGSATVLMASNLDLPKNVKGIVTDCPFSSPFDIINTVCKRDVGISPKLAYPFLMLGASLFAGINLKSVTATKCVEEANVPILIIHGEDDRFVPCEMSREIYNVNPNIVKLETFTDAGHGLSFMKDTKRYEEVLNEFLNYCHNINKPTV